MARLSQQLHEADPDNDFDREVLSILNQLCWGLDRLAIGEEPVPDIFRPAAKGYRGWPGAASKIQQLRWRAVFYVEAMVQLHKMPPGEAIKQVAAAFDISSDYLWTWRKPIINTKTQTDSVVKAREEISECLIVMRSAVRMGWQKGGLDDLLKMAKTEGKRLKAGAKGS